jgi:hypothetical protein
LSGIFLFHLLYFYYLLLLFLIGKEYFFLFKKLSIPTYLILTEQGINGFYCQAQVQLAIAIKTEMSLALYSL